MLYATYNNVVLCHTKHKGRKMRVTAKVETHARTKKWWRAGG